MFGIIDAGCKYAVIKLTFTRFVDHAVRRWQQNASAVRVFMCVPAERNADESNSHKN